MTWYAASVIMAFELIEGPQERWGVWENIVLVEAPSPDEALAKVEARARDEAAAEDSLTIDDRPAIMRFVGVRKLMTMFPPTWLDIIERGDHPPVDGTEVTFNWYELKSRDDVERLARGETVTVTYFE